MRIKLDNVVGIIFALLVIVDAFPAPHQNNGLSTCDASTVYLTITPTICEVVSTKIVFSFSTIDPAPAPAFTVTLFFPISANSVNSASSYGAAIRISGFEGRTSIATMSSTITALQTVTYTNYDSDNSAVGKMISLPPITTITSLTTLFTTQTEVVATSTISSSSPMSSLDNEPVITFTAYSMQIVTIYDEHSSSRIPIASATYSSIATAAADSSSEIVFVTETITIVPLLSIPIDTSHVSILPPKSNTTPASFFSTPTGAGSMGWNYTASQNPTVTTGSWLRASSVTGFSVTTTSGYHGKGSPTTSNATSHPTTPQISVLYNASQSLGIPTTPATSAKSGFTTSSVDPHLFSLISHSWSISSAATSITTYGPHIFNITVAHKTTAYNPYMYNSTAVSNDSSGRYPSNTNSIATAVSFTNSQISNATSTSKFSAPTSIFPPGSCGPSGEFVLNFDDIPPLAASNETATPEPIFCPYDHFYYSMGFFVVPPPTDPYRPSSPPLLLEFIPGLTTNKTIAATNASSTDIGISGDIGIGPGIKDGCFSFNFLGASLGCDSLGPDCDWQFTGSRYNYTTGVSQEIVTQYTSTPACSGLASSSCDLIPVLLENRFENLTSIRINVTVSSVPKIWWLDDLRLGWFEDNCEGETCRQNAIGDPA